MLILVMGVSGSGKSTAGKLLAERLGFDFVDADDFHPESNIHKMATGIPLTDADRLPWLSIVRTETDKRLSSGTGVVLSCSALKHRYRETLLAGRSCPIVVYLKGERDLLRRRLELRQNHFMKSGLLESQFADLEEPLASEAKIIDISLPLEEVVKAAAEAVTSFSKGPQHCLDFAEAEKRIPRLPDKRFLLGIAGAPGAGKSTMAEYLVSRLNKKAKGKAALLPMDGYHYSNERLTEMNLLSLKGIPATFDARGFVDKVKEIKQAPEATHYAPRFDRSLEASIEAAIEILPSHKIVVSEGNYLLLDEPPWNELQSLFDEIWYLHSEPEVIFERLIARHQAGGKDPLSARAKVESTDLPNTRLVEKSRHRASIVVRFSPIA